MRFPYRYSVPVLQTVRGAGFGNEVITWGKAFIGAQELGLRTLHPAWALNPRGYRHDFQTSIFDWPAQQILRGLPKVEVDTARASTQDDYADVMRDLRPVIEERRGPVSVFHSSGMSGGYYSIRQARPFLRASITAPNHVTGDLYRITRMLDPEKLTVALHVRAGDFSLSLDGPAPGQFNAMLPLDWYLAVGKNLRAALADHIEFQIFTDDETNAGIVSLARELKTRALPYRSRPLLSDIAAMSGADLLVCSVSSLSMFAAFISEKPYIWYGPHLGEHGGFRSIWGHEERQRTGLTSVNAAREEDPLFVRGTASMQDGGLTDSLVITLEQQLAMKSQRHDLVMYGVIRSKV